jgi:hypothetical protein
MIVPLLSLAGIQSKKTAVNEGNVSAYPSPATAQQSFNPGSYFLQPLIILFKMQMLMMSTGSYMQGKTGNRCIF